MNYPRRQAIFKCAVARRYKANSIFSLSKTVWMGLA